MPKIRVIAVPPGEAPAHIRRAWVGLSLPLLKGEGIGPSKSLGTGVLSGPKSFVGLWMASKSGRCEEWEGYKVDALTSVEILARTHPEAAKWWHEETPHLMARERALIFPADVCEIEEDDKS